jgi:hypothetical protein
MKNTVLFFLLLVSISAFSQRTWSDVIVDETCSFKIPPTLEIRNKKSFHESIVNGLVKTLYNVNIHNDRLVICPKGFESLEDMAIKLYARIIIWNEDEGDAEDYEPIKKWTQEYKTQMNKMLPVLLKEQAKSTGTKIVHVSAIDYPVIGGRTSMHYTYVRTSSDITKSSDEYNVIVNVYRFFNGNSATQMNFSYQKCESHLWKNDFKKVINSISFTNKINK